MWQLQCAQSPACYCTVYTQNRTISGVFQDFAVGSSNVGVLNSSRMCTRQLSREGVLAAACVAAWLKHEAKAADGNLGGP